MLYPDHRRLDRRGHADRLLPLARANIAAETSANRFSAAGGAGTVLRFGWFYGPGAAHLAVIRTWSRDKVAVRRRGDTAERQLDDLGGPSGSVYGTATG